jgi:hypothetical protein
MLTILTIYERGSFGVGKNRKRCVAAGVMKRPAVHSPHIIEVKWLLAWFKAIILTLSRSYGD